MKTNKELQFCILKLSEYKGECADHMLSMFSKSEYAWCGL